MRLSRSLVHFELVNVELRKELDFHRIRIMVQNIAKLSPKPQPQLGAELALISSQPSHPPTHRTSKKEL